MQKECVVYIGDFDFSNENVQSFLVKNNSKIFNKLGYTVFFVGINRNVFSIEKKYCFKDLKSNYLELPNTLTFLGIFYNKYINKIIIDYLSFLSIYYCVKYVITYQFPTYSAGIKNVGSWCKQNNAYYLVHSADLPVFYNQGIFKRKIMKKNWNLMHKLNKKYGIGFITVSEYIKNFYFNKEKKFIIIPPLFDYSNFIFNDIKLNDTTTFVYCGTPFGIRKHAIKPKGMKDRLDLIIDLFCLLSKKKITFKLIIIGLQKSEYLISVPRHQDFLNSENNIVFLGKLEHNKSLEYIYNSDFSINYRDVNRMTLAGFSTKLVESVSLGTPVITNEIGDNFKYLEENFSVFRLTNDIDYNLKQLTKLCLFPKEDNLNRKKELIKKRVFDFNNYIPNMKAFLSLIDNERVHND